MTASSAEKPKKQAAPRRLNMGDSKPTSNHHRSEAEEEVVALSTGKDHAEPAEQTEELKIDLSAVLSVSSMEAAAGSVGSAGSAVLCSVTESADQTESAAEDEEVLAMQLEDVSNSAAIFC